MGIQNDIKQKVFKSEYQKLVINILYTASWLGSKQQSVMKQFAITPQQYNVLRILRGAQPQPMKVADIASRMIDKMSNASRIVDKLELKGLVSRKACSEDRRAVDVCILTDGLTLLTEIDPLVDSIETEFGNFGTDNAVQLNQLLDLLRNS